MLFERAQYGRTQEQVHSSQPTGVLYRTGVLQQLYLVCHTRAIIECRNHPGMRYAWRNPELYISFFHTLCNY